jgi:hypothetical protein
MWKTVTAPLNFVKTAFAFLQTGAVPPGTPPSMEEQMKKTNHLASKKFFVVGVSFLILGFFYFASVCILFLLPQQSELIGGYVTIFTKTIEVLAIIIASYLGVQAAIDFKYGSNSNTNFETISTSPAEKKIEEETQRFQNIYMTDNSYAPIKWSKSFEENI